MKKLLILLTMLVMCLISGCVSINSDINIKSDMSGQWDAAIQSQVGPLKKTDLEQPLQKHNLKDYTLQAVDAQGKKVEGASAYWKLTIPFKNAQELTAIDNTLTSTLGGGNVANVIQKDDKGIVTVNLGKSLGTTKITVPGKILTNNPNLAGTVDGKTITFQQGADMQFQYEESSYTGILIGVAIVVVIVAGGAIFYFKKKS